MTTVARFLTRRRSDRRPGRRGRLTVTDVLTYGYLIAGVLVMFGPVAWLVLSSFKTPANLLEFPPTLLPLAHETVAVPGYAQPLPLYEVTFEDGTTARLAQVRRVGLMAQMVDPAEPDEILQVPIAQRSAVR
jgi:alpha-1,4-digalacturonate transport system permease protein